MSPTAKKMENPVYTDAYDPEVIIVIRDRMGGFVEHALSSSLIHPEINEELVKYHADYMIDMIFRFVREEHDSKMLFHDLDLARKQRDLKEREVTQICQIKPHRPTFDL